MKVIGITGGVGAGKSAILDILEKEYNSYTIKADDIAKMLMTKGYKPYDDIVELIGERILNDDGTINRELMAKEIFSSEYKRLAVNSIVHPAVKKWIVEKIAYLRMEEKYEYIIIEAALLLEDHYDIICDEIWYVYASEDTRRERLKATRGYSDEKITSMFASQMKEQEFRERCAYTIDNDGSVEKTRENIQKLLNSR